MSSWTYSILFLKCSNIKLIVVLFTFFVQHYSNALFICRQNVYFPGNGSRSPVGSDEAGDCLPADLQGDHRGTDPAAGQVHAGRRAKWFIETANMLKNYLLFLHFCTKSLKRNLF